MNRSAFFASARARASGIFGTALSDQQVQGCEAILDSCIRNNVTNIHHVANILAQVYHEGGGYMLPIKETVMPSHTNKNPSDATVIKRLDTAFAKGQLSWVKTPYWRDGAFGRGPIQITHWSNYEKMGKRLSVDLRKNPSLALDPKIGADIAVVGMKEGLFTGRKLSDYSFPAALDAKPASNPRRIVNGPDGTDAKIAGYHRAFHSALVAAGVAAGYSAPAKAAPAPSVPVSEPPVTKTDKITIRVVQERLKELGYSEVGTPDGIMGKLTRTAILAFRNENDLPVSDVIDDTLLNALDTARSRNLPRKDATPVAVREAAPEVKSNWMTKLGAGAGAGAAGIAGISNAVLDHIAPWRNMFSDIPSWVWFGGAALIFLVLLLIARRGEQKGIEAFQAGERR